jgi:hypothetical protein
MPKRSKRHWILPAILAAMLGGVVVGGAITTVHESAPTAHVAAATPIAAPTPTPTWAPPASNADAMFVNVVEAQIPALGTGAALSDSLVKLGHAECGMLTTGSSYESALADSRADILNESDSVLTIDDAEIILNASIEAYCPQYEDQIVPDGSN